MNFLQALILGIIQGVTEFFPISSSAHLVLIPNLLRWPEHPLVFDTTLHLGTALAISVFFFKDFLVIAKSFLDDIIKKADYTNFKEDSKLGVYIIIGMLPAGIVGFLFESYFETVFRSVSFMILFLFLGSLLILFAEKKRVSTSTELNECKSFKVGLFQMLALLPGFSRSGSTISGGMILGLSREKATRFSFLMSVPIIVLAGIYKLISSFYLLNTISVGVLLVGFLSSFFVGLISIKFLLNFVKTNSLRIFVIYRLLIVLLFCVYPLL